MLSRDCSIRNAGFWIGPINEGENCGMLVCVAGGAEGKRHNLVLFADVRPPGGGFSGCCCCCWFMLLK